MTGIEKIIAKIEEDCQTACEEILRKAEEEARGILNAADVESAARKAEAQKDADEKCRKARDLALSRADRDRKKELLAVKADIIRDFIREAMERMKKLPAQEYFEAVASIAVHYAQKGHGVMRFSEKDLARLPKGFCDLLNAALQSSGRSVEISGDPADVDGGFILYYGDIEENCTFDSLLAASLDDIKDRLYEEIFLKGGL